MGIFDKLFGRKEQYGGKFGSKKVVLEEVTSKGRHGEVKESQLDSWIEKLGLIPEEYRDELIKGLILSLGPSEMKLACICLIRQKDYFETELTDNTRVKSRFIVTETPYNRPILGLYIKIFDYDNPGIDEMTLTRDKRLKIMTEQDHTYLIIADPKYRIYYRKKIIFDEILREDLDKIKKAFVRYGEESGKTTIGEDPGIVQAIIWYQNNVSLMELDRKYFS